MPRTKAKCTQIREHTKKQIIEAAIQLFAYKGFAATKISEVAKVAGVSMGLMYHYFPSKDELFAYIVEETVRINSEKLLAFDQLELEVEEKIKLFSKTISEEILMKKVEVFRFMMMIQGALYTGDASINKALFVERTNSTKIIVTLIKKAQAKGIGKEGDPLILADLFWATMRGLCIQQIVIPDNTKVPTAEMISGLLLK